MTEAKIKEKASGAITDLRKRAARHGIFSLAELARRIPCARESIYFALERPSRFPRVTKRINELTDDKILTTNSR